MTPAELLAECRRRQSLGLARLQLVASFKGNRFPSRNRRAWPGGPPGEWIGKLRAGEWMVAVKIEDALAWLRKQERR